MSAAVSDEKLLKLGLGKVPDLAIAKLAKCSLECIFGRRKRLGIPACRRHSTYLSDEELVKLDVLGKCPDKEASKKAGMSVHHIRQARKRLGILPYTRSYRRQPKVSDEKFLEGLGKLPDIEVAKLAGYKCVSPMITARGRLGLSAVSTSHKKGRRTANPTTEDFETKTNSQIARECGLSRERIRQLREKSGLAKTRNTRLSNALEVLVKAGIYEKTRIQVAKELIWPAERVYRYCKRLNIPAYKKPKPGCRVCGRVFKHLRRGDLCPAHSRRLELYGDVNYVHPNYAGVDRTWPIGEGGTHVRCIPAVCTICGKPSHSKKLCLKHYRRLRKYGDPLIKRITSKGVVLRDEITEKELPVY